MFSNRNVRRRGVTAGVLVAALLAALVSLTVASSALSARSAVACGTLPNVAPPDPAKTLAKATSTAKAQYNGWPFTLQKSALANWKPKGKPPYTVGVIFDGLSNPFQAFSYNLINKFLKRGKNVGKVIGVVSEAGNSAKQIQAYQSLVQQGADVIVVQSSSAPALVDPVKAALKQGTATVGLINAIDDPSAVSIVPNIYTTGGASLAGVLKLIKGQGTILGVHGIRVTQVDKVTWEVYNKVLASCPNVKLAAEIDGNFAPPAVRSAVLQYLSTNPGKVDAVIQTANMGASIIGAFQQAGREVPPVQGVVASKGELAYWNDNKGKGYNTVAIASGPTAYADGVVRVVLRVLAGQGPRTNMIPWLQPIVTSANLSQYVKPGWTLETPGTAEQPKTTYWKDKDLDSLFLHPERKAGGY